MIPGVSHAASSAYEAARRRAGVIDRSDRGRIVVSGKDRAGYLQGMLTNDIAALRAGEGCYAAYLTPQGRMIADLWVYELGDVILLSLPLEVTGTVLGKLDQFIFSEDVQLGDVTDTFAHLAVVGPRAAAILEGILSDIPAGTLAALPEHGNRRARFAGQPSIVARVTDAGEPGYDVLVDAPARGALLSELRRAGASEIDGAMADVLRVEAGLPKFHRDMDEDTIPLEAGIESRAINLNKGCYVGQEVIIRVLHRGHGRVARKLVGLTIEGDAVPKSGTVVQHDGKDIGQVTSGVASVALRLPIALAYVQRDFVEPGTRVSVGGADAVVTELPFVKKSG